MTALLLCDPGLEALAAEELLERCPAAVLRSAPPGSVIAAGAAISLETLTNLRLVEHVATLHLDVEVATLDDVRAAVGPLEIPALRTARSFRATAHLHAGATLDKWALARAGGGALHRHHGTPVDLTGFETEVRLDLFGPRLLVSEQHSRMPLSKRVRRGRSLRVSLRATHAAALLRLVDLRGATNVCDPTCGAGTILVEAAAVRPELRLYGSDWDEDTVGVCRATLANHGLAGDVRRLDARDLGSWGRRFERIVSNPPFGLRVGRRTEMHPLYRDLLASWVDALAPGGRIALLSPRRQALEQAARQVGLEVLRAVDLGTPAAPRMYALAPR